MSTDIIDTFGQAHPINATRAHEKVSGRYKFVSTAEILTQFANAGWQPKRAEIAGTRWGSNKQGFQKHMVRLEHPDYDAVPGLTDAHKTRPQLIVINSHDRGSALRITWGLFRFVCANGMIVGQSYGDIRLRHTGDIVDSVPGAVAAMIANMPKMVNAVQRLQSTQLSDAATARLIKTIYDARLQGVKHIQAVDYRMPSLRRYADQGTDAYSVFNRLQEVALRGGIRYRTAAPMALTDEQRRLYGEVLNVRNGRTRAVSAIAESVRINTVAFDAAMELVA